MLTNLFYKSYWFKIINITTTKCNLLHFNINTILKLLYIFIDKMYFTMILYNIYF